MSYTCDVTLYFRGGQPAKTMYIGEGHCAKSKEHAISLAKLDVQAKGWDLKLLDEVHVSGGRER